MGFETTSTGSPFSSSSASASPNAKRGRDPEDEVYLDNFHFHKRYLSEIMASSLNGLTVGDSLTENLIESPSRYEISEPYSPMAEDLGYSQLCETSLNSSLVHSDVVRNPPGPISPHMHQKTLTGFSSANPYPLPGCTFAAVVCCRPCQHRSNSEGRFPSSPSDVRHTTDLRRVALLRSVQMRTQMDCPPPYQLPFHNGRNSAQNIEEDEYQSFSCFSTLDDESSYESPEHVADFVVNCSSAEDLLVLKLHEDNKSYGVRHASERN